MNLEDIISPATKSFAFIVDNIDFKISPIIGLGAGVLTYYINREHPVDEALLAGLKQFGYNVIVSGVIIKNHQKMIERNFSILNSAVTNTLLAFVATYLTHKIGQTPESFLSSIW